MAKAPSVPDEPCCSRQQNYGVSQSPDEVEFERGLWQPAMEGNVERVEELLAKSFDVDARDSAGYTPLLYAARNGHYRVCKILLQHGADVNASTRSIGATPLHRAASQSHPEVVNTLLRYGADANLTDVDGKTALHRAIPELNNSFEEARDVCKMLLEVTDPTIEDKSGKTVKDVFKQRYQNLKDPLDSIDFTLSKSLDEAKDLHKLARESIDKFIEEMTEQEIRLKKLTEMKKKETSL